jgi:E3 ubiquitin-protein ligase HECTD2
MAPWPSRHDSHGANSANHLASRHQSSAVNRPSPRAEQLNGLADLDSSQIIGDSSSSESDIHPSRPIRPPHSRSMSHPFPSLFSSGKKKKHDASGNAIEDLISSGDETPRMVKPQEKITHRRGVQAAGGSRDYATGNCMTCGSLVRWPKDLRVFKCTICVTVNDLQPYISPAERSAMPAFRRGSQSTSPTGPPAPSTSPGKRPSPLLTLELGLHADYYDLYFEKSSLYLSSIREDS